MDLNEMYDDALTEEKRAVGVISLVILIMAILFFFAGLFYTGDAYGLEEKLIKDILVATSVVLMIGGFVPQLISAKMKKEVY